MGRSRLCELCCHGGPGRDRRPPARRGRSESWDRWVIWDSPTERGVGEICGGGRGEEGGDSGVAGFARAVSPDWVDVDPWANHVVGQDGGVLLVRGGGGDGRTRIGVFGGAGGKRVRGAALGVRRLVFCGARGYRRGGIKMIPTAAFIASAWNSAWAPLPIRDIVRGAIGGKKGGGQGEGGGGRGAGKGGKSGKRKGERGGTPGGGAKGPGFGAPGRGFWGAVEIF